jgi:hypothetical protein
VVHSSAVAATSGPFRALVNGNLIEAKKRCAELEDVEPEDFVRFLEYAYRRDYTAPSWIHDESTCEFDRQDDSQAAEEPPPPPDDVPEAVTEAVTETVSEPEPAAVPEPEPAVDVEPTPLTPTLLTSGDPWEFTLGRLSKKEKKSKKSKIAYDMAMLRAKWHRRNYIGDAAPNADIIEESKPKSNSAADQDFTPVFLAHARLYTFADMRLIYPLKGLALQKLYMTLSAFQLYHQRVGDIVKLARYAYDHGSDRSTAGVVNDLRELVVEYIASEVEIVGKHPDFKALLEDGGEFVTDFWKVVSKYLLKA